MNELRKLANRAIQECMYSDFYAAANPAAVISLLDEIDRLTREAVAADIRIANDATVIAGLTAERDELRAALAERDAKLAALEKQEPVAWMNNKRDMTYFGHYNKDDLPLYAAAGAAPVPEGWRSAVALAYGHLWHVNNEPMAPVPLRSDGEAAYAARKLLRDLLTTEERGDAINAVQKLLAAAPKEQS